VMEEIWRRHEVSVRGVMEALNGRAAKHRAYTTYMTIMTRLDTKGLLERRRQGRRISTGPSIRVISTPSCAPS
jgi:predicted transcriptional regulator